MNVSSLLGVGNIPNHGQLGGTDHKTNSIVNDPDHYYKFLEILGEGSFCKVFRALYHPT